MTSAATTPEVRLDRTTLIDSFGAAGKPRESWLVGGEYERHLLRADGTPVPYFGDHGVAWLLDRMLAGGGWKPYYEGEHVIALLRGRASVTLEPGSQWEFSSEPHRSVRDLIAEVDAFNAETARAIGDADLHPVALGFTPFAKIPEIPWVPKGRYVIMREHLGATGPLAHHMMKGTCAVQATYDFGDEADCAHKVSLGTSFGPLTTALFANSPISEGRPSGFATFRGHIWTQTDPARTGFPEAAARFTFERWVDYLLDAPMMFTKIGGRWEKANGLTFRAWMERGIGGVYPTWDDWDLHLTSVFPEVRVKRGIEVRGADCVPAPLNHAFAALFEGLFYGTTAGDRSTELAAAFRAAGTPAERFARACEDGLRAEVGGRTLASWAEDLLTIARDGLSRWRPEDAALLDPLDALVATGESPADGLLRAFADDPTPGNVIRVAAFR